MKHVEIEIKFEIPFELIALFIDWVTPLAKSSATHAHLENHYFDTKQHDFKKIGVGLRTRMRNGEKCVQTLKWHSDTHLGNLNQFHELTEALTEPVPDLKAFSQEDLPEHVAKNIDTFVVEEQFRTDFNRQYWQVVHNNTHIKVTLDQGKVTCPDTGHAPHILREVELELQQGDIKDLISFAQEFIQLGSMRLGYHTKAAWGDRVYHNYPKPEIHRLPWAPLHAELLLSEAITRIFSSALKHSQYHTQCFFDAPSLSALMQVRNGFAMIHQAVLLFSPRPLAHNNLTWIEKLIQTEHHLSWLGLANAQKRWCRTDGYKQQRWPHSDILTKFMAYMQSQWPEAHATQAWMQSTEYLDMQLTLTQWIASLTNNLKRETKEPLLSYAQKKLDNHWMHLTTTSWQEKSHQSGLLKMTGPLRRGLIISLCLGGVFSHASARNQFQQAWLDVSQGLEDLHWLETLETSLHKMTQEPSVQADLRVWLQSRQTLLVEVLENSYQNACEQAWYWHEV